MIFINHIIVKTRKILLKSLKICHYCWSIINAIGTRLGQVKSLGLLVAFVFLSFCHKFVYLYFPSTPLRCGLVIFAIGYCILLLFFVMSFIAFVCTEYCNRPSVTSLGKTLIFYSTTSNMFRIASIIGAKDMDRQKVLPYVRNLPVYEIHLKKSYSKVGMITERDIAGIFRQLQGNYNKAVFYTYTSIYLKNILTSFSIPHTLIYDYPTNVNPNHAKRVKNRSSHYWFYMIKF